jgi:hypothetical protein
MRGKAQRCTQLRCASDCVVATASGGIDHTSQPGDSDRSIVSQSKSASNISTGFYFLALRFSPPAPSWSSNVFEIRNTMLSKTIN